MNRNNRKDVETYWLNDGSAFTFQKNERSGITLIEVLTAVMVATIGVLGVLVLIPLGSRFTESGFDKQRSRQLANNAIQRFEAYGVLNFERWVFKADMTNTNLNDGFERVSAIKWEIVPGKDQDWGILPSAPRAALSGLTGYCFDPVFVSASGLDDRSKALTAGDPLNTQFGDGGLVRFFPYSPNTARTEIEDLRVPRMSIAGSDNLNNNTPMDATIAEDLGAGDDFLALQTGTNEQHPPFQMVVQHYDNNRNKVPLKRDSSFNMSSFAMLLPTAVSVSASDPTGSFRLVTLVIKDRIRQTGIGSYERVFRVTNTDGSRANVSGGFGEVALETIDGLPNPWDPVNGTPLRRGDWLIFFPYDTASRTVGWAGATFFEIRNASEGSNQFSVVGNRYSAGNRNLDTLAIHVPGMIDFRERNVQLNIKD